MDELKTQIANLKEEIAYIKESLRMERELYVNIRELLKCRDRELDAMKEAYDMQIDLVKALEDKIDRLVRKEKTKVYASSQHPISGLEP